MNRKAPVVEHRDRFARFEAEYVEVALEAQERRLLVVDPSEVDDDLVRGVTEILTSLCARAGRPTRRSEALRSSPVPKGRCWKAASREAPRR